MAIDPPISSQEALHQAMLEASTLRKRLPAAKAGEVLDAFDRIEEIWAKQGEGQFPFIILIKEMNAIKATLREAFGGELDLPVDWRSPVFEQVIEFDQKIRIYSDLMMVNPVYSSLEKRLQRLEEVLPPRNYGLREILNELRSSFDLSLKQRLESALKHFGVGQYESTLSECGKAEGILFTHFKKVLENLEVKELPSQIGSAFSKIRSQFSSRNDKDGLSLSKSGRLELLVLSMFETLHYFRNIGAHDRAEEVAEEKLPEWQVQRREYFTQKPEYARLALVLTSQIALELQALLDHQRNTT
jgi:hypothetical protein